MGLESATHIHELNASNPVGATDPKSQGDDHIRLIKSALQNTFANVDGAVTASHTELNKLAGLTATNAELNKLAGLTATTAELNKLAGTAAGLTAAELSVLDGITATTAELNKLAGTPAGLTATELGYVDGVTSAIQTQLNARATSTYGYYTPSVVNIQNVTSRIERECMWTRVGDVVTVSGNIDVAATAANTATTIRISLPVASDLQQYWDAAGGGGSRYLNTETALVVTADPSTNNVILDWVSLTTSTISYVFTFSYRVR